MALAQADTAAACATASAPHGQKWAVSEFYLAMETSKTSGKTCCNCHFSGGNGHCFDHKIIWDDLMWKKMHTKMTIPNDLWYTNSYTNHIHKTGDNFEQLVFECLSHFEIHCAILTPVPRKIQQELIWLSTRPPSKRLGWKVQQSHVVSTCIILHHLVIPMPGKQHLFQQAWLTNDKRFFVAMVRKCGSSAWLSTEGVCMSNSHPNTNSHLFAPH